MLNKVENIKNVKWKSAEILTLINKTNSILNMHIKLYICIEWLEYCIDL